MTTCPDCGNQLEPDAQFCPKCFARVEPPGLWRKLLAWFQGAGTTRRPLVSVHKTVSIKTTDPDGQKHEYHSLDEVPPELRDEIRKIESEALKETFRGASVEGSTIKMTSKKSLSIYKIKDQDGNERVYHSLEELPPDIRKALEQAQRDAKE